ncbi:MAG: XRE family transcriptional regulator, partial [Acutalibacteraceae bacterium]
SYRLGLVVGILLCVISVLPLFISMALEQEFLTICAVCLMLLFIAIGVYLIVRVVCVWSSYQKLLEEEEYTREKKAENKRNDPFSSFYWCLVTALYLGISFFTNAWDRTWIIWPVAGVLFAAILAFKQMLTRSR